MAKGKLTWKRPAKGRGMSNIGHNNERRPWHCYKGSELVMALYNGREHWHQEGEPVWRLTIHGKKPITFAKTWDEDRAEEAKLWAVNLLWDIKLSTEGPMFEYKKKLGYAEEE